VPAPSLKKTLGQHHLVDGRLCQPLISFLRPAGQRVLEVGPGGGVLTAELVRAGARVWAWELDPEWALPLRAIVRSALRRSGGPEWEGGLVVGDAMEVPWSRLPEPTLAAGNLPYAIATALVARVIRHPRRVPRSAFLVQKEVADRLAASAGDSDYGALSVLVAARAEVRLLGRVKAGSFRPPPKVDGAFVALSSKEPPLPPEEMDRFEATVRQAFSQRRKTLRNSLGAAWGKDVAERVLEAAGVPAGARAQELPLADFLRLHAAYAALSSSRKW
jgi:16S rRNA (adenine1518-N6/adenine1519-N6)-dimethyltransferase